MKLLRAFPAAALCAAAGLRAEGPSASPFQRALPIPPLLAPASADGVMRFELSAQAGSARFFADRPTPTYGYNGLGYLGPTIRLTRGRPAQIAFRNRLEVPSSLHLHGLEVVSAADTTPENCCAPLKPGQLASTPVFTPDQPGATLWYHPHPYGDTGRQVYMGLAGLLILDDPAEAALALPHEYGVDDIPLLVQDRRFKTDRSLAYLGREGEMEGMLGDRILVNGALAPHLDLAATRVRLRLVNASNARAYRFALGDGRSFQQIASDGGLLPAPATVDEVFLPPAARAEIVVDFSGDADRSLYLVSRAFEAHADSDDFALHQGVHFVVMELRIGAFKPSAPLPAKLRPMPALDLKPVSRTRSFELEKGGEHTINGLRFDPERIDARVKAGAWEVWTVSNDAKDEMHPFHVHGVQFRVLERSGAAPGPGEQGWKDTVAVAPGETVKLLIHFDKQLGRYMFHCHVLEHEDMGMMGNYVVEK